MIPPCAAVGFSQVPFTTSWLEGFSLLPVVCASLAHLVLVLLRELIWCGLYGLLLFGAFTVYCISKTEP
jgi:hypothetical protein